MYVCYVVKDDLHVAYTIHICTKYSNVMNNIYVNVVFFEFHEGEQEFLHHKNFFQ